MRNDGALGKNEQAYIAELTFPHIGPDASAKLDNYFWTVKYISGEFNFLVLHAHSDSNVFTWESTTDEPQHGHGDTSAMRMPAHELELFRVNVLQLIADVKERMRHPVTPEASVDCLQIL